MPDFEREVCLGIVDWPWRKAWAVGVAGFRELGPVSGHYIDEFLVFRVRFAPPTGMKPSRQKLCLYSVKCPFASVARLGFCCISEVVILGFLSGAGRSHGETISREAKPIVRIKRNKCAANIGIPGGRIRAKDFVGVGIVDEFTL
jgi:hypothetical protein